MFPYLKIGVIKIPMYGLLIATGTVIGVLIAMNRAKKRNSMNPDDLLYCVVYTAMGAILGGKVLYFLTSLEEMSANASYYFTTFTGFIEFLQYGFVFYGGLIGGLLVLFLYVRKQNLNISEIIRLIIPVVPLVHSFGRIGCFCAGCCYGIPMAPPWGVFFSPEGVGPVGISVFPVQLLEAALNFVLFLGLFTYTKKERAANKILGWYLLCYAVERFILEFFRNDARGIYFGVSTSQWIGIFLIPVAVVLLLGRYEKLSKWYHSKYNFETDTELEEAESVTEEENKNAEDTAEKADDAAEASTDNIEPEGDKE